MDGLMDGWGVAKANSLKIKVCDLLSQKFVNLFFFYNVSKKNK